MSITVNNNLRYSEFKNNVKIFGQYVSNPMDKNNFFGIQKTLNFFKSNNKHLANEMCKIINKNQKKINLIEIHNRPYLVKYIKNKIEDSLLTLFLHNDPLTMKGSKSIQERKDILSVVSKVYCVSNFIKNKFLEGINKNKSKVVVLYNGVERSLKKFPKKEKSIIFVGRVVEDKGVHFYVDAIDHIYEHLKDWNFKIIGSPKLGNNLYKSTYSNEVLSKFRNIGKRTHVLGFLNQKRLKNLFRKSSIIVIPSVWDEPFGLVAAEGMANGLAIISSKKGGLKEVVGKNGLIIKDFSSKNIYESIRILTKDNKTLNLYQKLSWDSFRFNSKDISKTLDLYRRDILSNIS